MVIRGIIEKKKVENWKYIWNMRRTNKKKSTFFFLGNYKWNVTMLLPNQPLDNCIHLNKKINLKENLTWSWG